MSYCDNCDCFDCVSTRETKEREASLAQIMETWNWNLNPTECALAIIEREDFTSDQFFKAMRSFGFSEGLIYDVEGAYDALSDDGY